MPVLKKTKQELVSEFRCREILEAACKVFARKGFSGATVDEIAEAAGLAKGTVYLYFRSKREIYLAALKRGFTGLIDETRRNMEAAPTTAAKLKAFITTRLRYAEENRDFVAIYHAEFSNVGMAYLGKEFRHLYLQQARALEAVLREGCEQGCIRRSLPAGALGLVVYEMTRGLIMQRLLGWSLATSDEDTEFLFDLLWKGVSADGG